jgi:hypothetical protein
LSCGSLACGEEMLAPFWDAIDGLLRRGTDAIKSGRRTEEAMRRSREQLR